MFRIVYDVYYFIKYDNLHIQQQSGQQALCNQTFVHH